MNTKAFFSCGEGLSLILGIGREKKIFLEELQLLSSFFHFGMKKSLPSQIDLCNPKMVLHTVPGGNYNFLRSTNKIKFLMEF